MNLKKFFENAAGYLMIGCFGALGLYFIWELLLNVEGVLRFILGVK